MTISHAPSAHDTTNTPLVTDVANTGRSPVGVMVDDNAELALVIYSRSSSRNETDLVQRFLSSRSRSRGKSTQIVVPEKPGGRKRGKWCGDCKLLWHKWHGVKDSSSDGF